MSSAFLYLAIVAVWAIFLVPMWLRRDTDNTGRSWFPHRRASEDASEELESDADADADIAESDIAEATDTTDMSGLDAAPPPRRRQRRAAVIARRRRRTSGLVLSVVISAIAIGIGLAPWWVVVPPIVLLAGHLSLLRVAVNMDAARRKHLDQARRLARAEAEAWAEEERRRAEQTTQAEIIDFNRRREVFDQYAVDTPRAVGD